MLKLTDFQVKQCNLSLCPHIQPYAFSFHGFGWCKQVLIANAMSMEEKWKTPFTKEHSHKKNILKKGLRNVTICTYL